MAMPKAALSGPGRLANPCGMCCRGSSAPPWPAAASFACASGHRRLTQRTLTPCGRCAVVNAVMCDVELGFSPRPGLNHCRDLLGLWHSRRQPVISARHALPH